MQQFKVARRPGVIASMLVQVIVHSWEIDRSGVSTNVLAKWCTCKLVH